MIRFCNGTPGQGINSNLSNKSWEPFREPIGPGSSQIAQASPLFRSAELCASGSPVLVSYGVYACAWRTSSRSS
jgi:hypothetical protein